MIKQLILVVQLLGLFFYQLIFTGDITVTQKIPDSITQGTEAIVEVTIKKDNISGFAKVQQVFPNGFTAEPIETKGATFSFKDNKVKFIWMALPSENEFTISYKIKPNETTEGDFILGGKFSFIADSERKNIEIPVANFSVVSNVVDNPVVDVTPVDIPPVVDEPVVDEPIITEPVVAEVIAVNCTRMTTKTDDNSFNVTVEINKKGIQGFAKITEEIPSGFVASDSDSIGGVFSFKENEVKILWMAIPREDKYSISYKLVANKEVENGTFSIKGYVSYLDKDITSKYDLAATSFKLSRAALIADEPVVDEPVVDEPVVDEPVVDKPVVDEPVVDEPVVTEVNNTSKVISSTPNPENGVSYKIQVCANHKKVASNYFALTFNLKDNVSTINHEGWIKYLVGTFNEYKAARDKRNKVRGNIKTAFVTAYNSGKRITVQEALMISNQKWYK